MTGVIYKREGRLAALSDSRASYLEKETIIALVDVEQATKRISGEREEEEKTCINNEIQGVRLKGEGGDYGS
jgi:hypothetical protein